MVAIEDRHLKNYALKLAQPNRTNEIKNLDLEVLYIGWRIPEYEILYIWELDISSAAQEMNMTTYLLGGEVISKQNTPGRNLDSACHLFVWWRILQHCTALGP